MNKHAYYMDALIDKMVQLEEQVDALDEIDDALSAEISETANALSDRARKLQRYLEDRYI